MAKSKNAVKSVLFPKTSTNEKAPKFNQIIEVEDDFVTDFDINNNQITELVAKMEKTGKFVLPEGLRLEGGFWIEKSKACNTYYKGNVQNPYVPGGEEKVA